MKLKYKEFYPKLLTEAENLFPTRSWLSRILNNEEAVYKRCFLAGGISAFKICLENEVRKEKLTDAE